MCNDLASSLHKQALILRLAPIVGPIIGSAFIIGLYMAARLVRGDLTDRMKMMNQVRGCNPCAAQPQAWE